MMPTFSVHIVGHVAREERARRLVAFCTGHEVDLHLDDGTLGAFGNHSRALTAAHPERMLDRRSHALVIEDDALPCIDLFNAAALAVAERPDHWISLYAGRAHPRVVERIVPALIPDADETGWLAMPHGRLWWGVGYIVPISDIPVMLAAADASTLNGLDRIAAHHVAERRVSYVWPSLVDHDDSLPSLAQRHKPGRVAWRVRG